MYANLLRSNSIECVTNLIDLLYKTTTIVLKYNICSSSISTIWNIALRLTLHASDNADSESARERAVRDAVIGSWCILVTAQHNGPARSHEGLASD